MPVDQLIFITLSLYFIGFAMLLMLYNKQKKALTSVLSIGINLTGLFITLVIINGFKESSYFNYSWASFSRSTFDASILVNKLTVLMWGLVQFISLLVQLFSIKYMQEDGRFTQYFAYLNLFVFSMLGLVCSGSLLFIFIFWELVGFSSYLLIGFWYKKQSATNASMKAFIMNKIGDTGFLIGIGFVYYLFGTLELNALTQVSYMPNTILTFTGLMLFGGCIGKSAQFPLQVWLPDAMAGPTPVSALIHAATMVAAGIFLLARIDFIFTPIAGQIIAFTGAFTALLAAYSALFQSDIKKVLAYSTVSQLGLMVMAMGAEATNAALFHLFTHAFFKAGLFLIAGAVIHYFHHEQNMFKMGGLGLKKPILAILFIICAASLTGLPLFSGFLSKDAVLISTWNWSDGMQNPWFKLIPVMGIIASLLTGAYMIRTFVLVFTNPEEKQKTNASNFSLSIFEWSILPLALFSIWIPFGVNPLDFEHSLFSKFFPITHQENHWLGYLVLILSLLAMIISYFRSKKEKLTEIKKLSIWQKIGLNHFYINWFYIEKIAKPIAGQLHFHEGESIYPSGTLHNLKGFSKLINKFDNAILDGSITLLSSGFKKLAALAHDIDNKLVDGFIKLVYTWVSKVGDRLKNIQGGKIQSYLIALILFLIAIIIFLNLL